MKEYILESYSNLNYGTIWNVLSVWYLYIWIWFMAQYVMFCQCDFLFQQNITLTEQLNKEKEWTWSNFDYKCTNIDTHKRWSHWRTQEGHYIVVNLFYPTNANVASSAAPFAAKPEKSAKQILLGLTLKSIYFFSLREILCELGWGGVQGQVEGNG